MPLLGAVVELPVVVPLGEDPVAAPPVADPLLLEVPPDCARAKPPESISVGGKANVASFMIDHFLMRP